MIQASKDEEEMLNHLFGELENGSNGNNTDNEDGSDGEDRSNATAREILTGYKAYSGGKLLIGTMPNREAVNETLRTGESFRNTPQLAYGWRDTETTPVTLNDAIPGKKYLVSVGAVPANTFGGWSSVSLDLSGCELVDVVFAKQDVGNSDRDGGYLLTYLAVVKATGTTISVKTKFNVISGHTKGLITISSYD